MQCRCRCLGRPHSPCVSRLQTRATIYAHLHYSSLLSVVCCVDSLAHTLSLSPLSSLDFLFSFVSVISLNGFSSVLFYAYWWSYSRVCVSVCWLAHVVCLFSFALCDALVSALRSFNILIANLQKRTSQHWNMLIAVANARARLRFRTRTLHTSNNSTTWQWNDQSMQGSIGIQIILLRLRNISRYLFYGCCVRLFICCRL